MILFTTIVASFCAEPVNIEVSTALPAATENQQQKRAIFSDCDGPIAGVVAGGLHSDVAVHSDLAIGLHGPSYAPSYSSGYAGYSGGYSGGYAGGYAGYSGGYSSGYLASGGIVGAVGSLGHVGGVVASPPIVSTGYAPHAPVFASSVISSPIVSHASVIAAPAVRH